MPEPGLILGEDGRARPAWAAADPLLRQYYDTEWGMPVVDERGLFERLSLEAFQSGLSWATILRKRENFREAFADFQPESVAEFTDDDVATLLDNAGIVRNRAKILATIANAQATLELRTDPELAHLPMAANAEVPQPLRQLEPGLPVLLWSHRPGSSPEPTTLDQIPTQSVESAALAKDLKRRGFRFVGPTTAFALMEAVGMLDTHLVGSWRRGTSGIW